MPAYLMDAPFFDTVLFDFWISLANVLSVVMRPMLQTLTLQTPTPTPQTPTPQTLVLQHGWLDAALIAVMVIGVVGTLYHRLKLELGIGDRAIQLVAICLVLPTVLILGLEGKIKEDSLGTIVGAMIGYALGSLGTPDPKKPKEKEGQESRELASKARRDAERVREKLGPGPGV